MWRLGRSFGLLVMCPLWALTACAPNTPETATTATNGGTVAVEHATVPPGRARDTEGAGGAGLLVALDPQTGELVAPDDSQLEEMRSRLSSTTLDALTRSSDGLRVQPAPGGGEMVDLQGRFRSVSYVKVGDDGRFEAQHGVPLEVLERSRPEEEGR